MSESRNILLIVSGGIAAYKSANLVRHFRKSGFDVRVVMTASAEEFIAPMTLQVLSENRVGRGLFEAGFEYEIGHIELARWPDLVVVAPATANLIAKARHGLADDLATTVLLATTAPVLFCPAMNTVMLEHVATQENLRALGDRKGVHILEPDDGELACKEVGAGRLPDAEVIGAEAERILSRGTLGAKGVLAPSFPRGSAIKNEPLASLRASIRTGATEPLAGRRVLVTAGPTREYFDPVRYISNPSTGRMGYALAAAFVAAGAETILVSGPTELQPPNGARFVSVTTAEQMKTAVFAESCDVAVMTAAVADYRPTQQLDAKRKKSDEAWQPVFERTPDILAELSRSNQRPAVLIGFAAETNDVEANASKKLDRKALDGIVANCVGGDSGAFGSDTNEVKLLSKDGSMVSVARAPKSEVAEQIVRWIVQEFSIKSGSNE